MSRVVFQGVVVSVVLLGLCAVSSAADFKLCNQSRSKNVLIFQVEKANQRNSYSKNWLSKPLGPGRCVNANFTNADFPCNIRFKATFADGKIDRGTTNICRNGQVNIHYK